jgi:hypothetical protein
VWLAPYTSHFAIDTERVIQRERGDQPAPCAERFLLSQE